MSVILHQGLYGVVSAYLGNALSLRDLEGWILQHDPELLSEPASDVARLSAIIDLGIADIRREHISEDELKADIQGFLSRVQTLDMVYKVSKEMKFVAAVSSAQTTESGNRTEASPVIRIMEITADPAGSIWGQGVRFLSTPRVTAS